MSISAYLVAVSLSVSSTLLQTDVLDGTYPTARPMADGRAGYVNFQNTAEEPAHFFLDGVFACSTTAEYLSHCDVAAAPGIHQVKAMLGDREFNGQVCVTDRHGMGNMGECELGYDDWGPDAQVTLSCFDCKWPPP
jgi:hypothetical protein